MGDLYQQNDHDIHKTAVVVLRMLAREVRRAILEGDDVMPATRVFTKSIFQSRVVLFGVILALVGLKPIHLFPHLDKTLFLHVA